LYFGCTHPASNEAHRSRQTKTSSTPACVWPYHISIFLFPFRFENPHQSSAMPPRPSSPTTTVHDMGFASLGKLQSVGNGGARSALSTARGSSGTETRCRPWEQLPGELRPAGAASPDDLPPREWPTPASYRGSGLSLRATVLGRLPGEQRRRAVLYRQAKVSQASCGRHRRPARCRPQRAWLPPSRPRPTQLDVARRRRPRQITACCRSPACASRPCLLL
jgi:hypothetical protein